jgi:hypothetical protein
VPVQEPGAGPCVPGQTGSVGTGDGGTPGTSRGHSSRSARARSGHLRDQRGAGLPLREPPQARRPSRHGGQGRAERLGAARSEAAPAAPPVSPPARARRGRPAAAPAVGATFEALRTPDRAEWSVVCSATRTRQPTSGRRRCGRAAGAFGNGGPGSCASISPFATGARGFRRRSMARVPSAPARVTPTGTASSRRGMRATDQRRRGVTVELYTTACATRRVGSVVPLPPAGTPPFTLELDDAPPVVVDARKATRGGASLRSRGGRAASQPGGASWAGRALRRDGRGGRRAWSRHHRHRRRPHRHLLAWDTPPSSPSSRRRAPDLASSLRHQRGVREEESALRRSMPR